MIRRGALASLVLLATILIPLPVAAQGGGAGAVRGVVIDADFAVPLARVGVSVVEIGVTVATSPDGTFVIENVAPGTYTLTFAKDGYERVVRSGVVVTPGRLADVRVELATEIVEMDEFVVTGEDFLAGTELELLDIRQTALTFQDAISSELISKAGASDVAGAIKFVTGASVVDGKYATVRGLSDRYTGTTLNGVRVPSADPRRRAVQIDLFPTGTVESVTVTKTFTPDLQGDFTGGGIDIKTKSVPDALIMSVSLSSEYNSLATGDDAFLTYEGGGVPTDGTDDGGRALPGLARPENLPDFAVPRPSTRPGIDEANLARAEAYDALARSFTGVMGTRTEAPGANSGLSVVLGNRFEAGRTTIGAIGALTWSHKFDAFEDGENNIVTVPLAGAGLSVDKQRTETRGVDELLIGGLGTLAIRPTENHEIDLRAIINRGAEDDARILIEDRGSTETIEKVDQNQAIRYTERELTSLQAHGEHTLPDLIPGATFGDLRIAWDASDNRSSQEEPDVRFFRNTFSFDTTTGIGAGSDPGDGTTDADNTRRIWRQIADDNRQYALDVALPFAGPADKVGEVKVGGFHDTTERAYDQLSFTYTFPSQLGGNNEEVRRNRATERFVTDDPDALWTDVFLDPDRIGLAPVRCVPPEWTFRNNCAAPDQLLWVTVPIGEDIAYAGEQEVTATYAMGDVPLSSRLRLILGARRESTRLFIEPFNPLDPSRDLLTVVTTFTENPETGNVTINRRLEDTPAEELVTDIDEVATLPSVGLVYEIRPGMNLRAAWSRTIARPTFRELAPAATEEFLAGDSFVGNPDLELSDITNYDLRWEWFPSPGDVLAASVFRKDLENPIELINFDAGGRFFIQPVNYDEGSLTGFELEGKAGLGRIGDRFRHFSVGANFAWIDSEVVVPEIEKTSLSDYDLDSGTRRLQGQPDTLVNVNVGYDNADIGLIASLFYNRVGETLISGAAKGEFGGIPSVLEQPIGTLDFKITKKLPKGMSVSLGGKNLLTPELVRLYKTPDGQEEVRLRRETPLKIKLSFGWSW